MTITLSEQQCLELIHEDEFTAEELLDAADPRLAKRFKKVDKLLIELLRDVRAHFPDAEYYTASGGFTLMLGSSHATDNGFQSGRGQQELVACNGAACIGDGDF